MVVTSGFAGAVASELKVGDLILAENFSDRELRMAAQRILSERKPRDVIGQFDGIVHAKPQFLAKS